MKLAALALLATAIAAALLSRARRRPEPANPWQRYWDLDDMEAQEPGLFV